MRIGNCGNSVSSIKKQRKWLERVQETSEEVSGIVSSAPMAGLLTSTSHTHPHKLIITDVPSYRHVTKRGMGRFQKRRGENDQTPRESLSEKTSEASEKQMGAGHLRATAFVAVIAVNVTLLLLSD